MTGTDLCVNKSQFVPVIFEPPCTFTPKLNWPNICTFVEMKQCQVMDGRTDFSEYAFVLWQRSIG
jgi:hypothetical protein